MHPQRLLRRLGLQLGAPALIGTARHATRTHTSRRNHRRPGPRRIQPTHHDRCGPRRAHDRTRARPTTRPKIRATR